jgi:hypothetical protein
MPVVVGFLGPTSAAANWSSGPAASCCHVADWFLEMPRSAAAELARAWELNRLAERLAALAQSAPRAQLERQPDFQQTENGSIRTTPFGGRSSTRVGGSTDWC